MAVGAQRDFFSRPLQRIIKSLARCVTQPASIGSIINQHVFIL